MRTHKIGSNYHPAHHGAVRPLAQIKLIVVHDMEDAAYDRADENTGAWFENAKSQGSTHYGCDEDSIEQYLPLNVIPWGAPSANSQGVHIELMGKAIWTTREWMTLALCTLDNCAFVLARLHARLNIPLVKLNDVQLASGGKGVVTHRQCSRVFKTPGGHSDPGMGFPMGFLLEQAGRYLA